MENLEKLVIELSKRVSELEQKLDTFLEKPKKVPNVLPQVKERDKTKYMFEGGIYSKNQLVLAVVKAYVKQHPNLTFLNLTQVFDKSLQGSLGVVQSYEIATKKTDATKRYYMNEAILLLNGKIVVCTQWGAFNIYKFILRAKELGFTIVEVSN